jgi:hypothetical protein
MKRYTPQAHQQSLLHDLANTVDRIENDGDIDLPAFGAAGERELVLRLAGAVSELLRRHPVDDQGRCRRCRPARAGCRRWWRLPTRKAPCLVLSVISFYATVPTEHVWLQLLAHRGVNRELKEIRSWLAGRPISAEPEPVWPSVDEPTQPGMTTPVPTIPLPSVEPPSGRHALSA